MIDVKSLSADELDFYEERVLIMWHDGGLTEAEAQVEAMRRVAAQRLRTAKKARYTQQELAL